LARPVIYDELTAPAVKALIDSGMEMAIMPTGATEQHGPHLPLNVDYLCAYRIALGVSAETGVPVLPALPFGHSGGHSGFPATLSLRPETFQRVVEEIAEWAYDTGFRRLLFLNGHLPNLPPLSCAVVNLRVRHPDYKVQAMSWWDITPELQKRMYGDSSYGLPHGNIVETSIMRYFRDDLVDMSKATRVEGRGQKLFFYYLLRQLSHTGHMGDPSGSTGALGEELYRMAVDGLVPQIKAALVEEPPVLDRRSDVRSGERR
jgi:creatinine amidohydrolase